MDDVAESRAPAVVSCAASSPTVVFFDETATSKGDDVKETHVAAATDENRKSPSP